MAKLVSLILDDVFGQEHRHELNTEIRNWKLQSHLGYALFCRHPSLHCKNELVLKDGVWTVQLEGGGCVCVLSLTNFKEFKS